MTPEEKDRVVRSLREACLKLVRRHGVQQTIQANMTIGAEIHRNHP